MVRAPIEFALATLATASPLAAQSMPSPLWSGADRLILNCTADAAAAQALGSDWCHAVLAEAQRDAAIPIVAAAAGQAVADRGALTLGVAAVDGEIQVTIARALSLDEAEGSVFRRGPALPPGVATDPHVRAAITAALDGVLPWRRTPHPARRSRRAAS